MAFFILRAMPVWDGEVTQNRRVAPFSVGFRDSAELIQREIRALKGQGCEIWLGIPESDLPTDGKLRSSQVRPFHPGVSITFGCAHGQLRYACDRFTDWIDNFRAIGLTLERLRKAELYGVVKRGEQYEGSIALPAPREDSCATLQDAVLFVQEISGMNSILDNKTQATLAYRQAARLLHPDKGGDARQWKRLEDAWALIRAHHAGRGTDGH